MTVTTPLLGQYVVRRLRLAMINMHTKFEVSSLSRSRDILAGTKNLKWVTWRDYAHFWDVLSSVGWDVLCSTHILSLKCLRLQASKKWRTTLNVKILVLSHPLGDLGVTNTDGLSMASWKARGRFPIGANWIFFASSHGCGTIKRNLSKSAFSEGVKVKVKVGFLYSAAYAMTGPVRFTISEVAVDWQEQNK